MDEQRREQLKAAEKAFNDALLLQAALAGKSVTRIAPDGCEVTATPLGYVFYNAADWY